MIGVAIGLFAVMIFSGLGNGVNGYIKQQVNSVANPQVIQVLENTTGRKMNQQKLMETFQNMAGNPQAGLISQHQIQRLSKVDGVKKVEKGFTLPTYRLVMEGTSKVQSGTGLSTWNANNKDDSIKYGHRPGKVKWWLASRKLPKLWEPKTTVKYSVKKRH